MKTFTQLTTEFFKTNGLEYSPELFKQLYKEISSKNINIENEKNRTELLIKTKNNESNSYVLKNMCYSQNKKI